MIQGVRPRAIRTLILCPISEIDVSRGLIALYIVLISWAVLTLLQMRSIALTSASLVHPSRSLLIIRIFSSTDCRVMSAKS